LALAVNYPPKDSRVYKFARNIFEKNVYTKLELPLPLATSSIPE